MKTFIIIILFIFSTKAYVQDQEVTIHFNDGTDVFGYGEIKDDWRISFRTSIDIDADVWTDTMVSGITFHGLEDDVEYRYMYKKED